jgi:sugar/nucleoside kinase (ribokinase family)
MEGLRQPEEATADERPIACLGEAIVDLICEGDLALGEAPESFVPWPGGALANVAVGVARSGMPAALVGGVGGDRWGGWLAGGLEREGVSTEWLASLDGADTPVALIEFGPDNEPSFQVYGEHIGPTMAATAGFLEEAIEAAQAVVIGSNTMVGETEREVTRRAVELTRSAGKPLLLDPNYRPNRWPSAEPARRFCRELTEAATVVKLNRGEAELITGLTDPVDAGRALAAMGPKLAVVTAGESEVFTAGAVEASHQPEKAETVSPLGAGDAFMGALAAGLARLGWDFTRAGEILPECAAAAAEVCGRWGAQ